MAIFVGERLTNSNSNESTHDRCRTRMSCKEDRRARAHMNPSLSSIIIILSSLKLHHIPLYRDLYYYYSFLRCVQSSNLNQHCKSAILYVFVYRIDYGVLATYHLIQTRLVCCMYKYGKMSYGCDRQVFH